MPNPEESARSPRVYVFHAGDSEQHVARVIEFATMLRLRAGIDANLPEWGPPQRTDQVVAEKRRFDEAEFVLVVASPEMRRLMDSTQPGDPRVTTGAFLTRDDLARDLSTSLKQKLPVVLPGSTTADIPRMLASYSTDKYEISIIDIADKDVQKLLRALLDNRLHAKPPLGPRYPIARDPEQHHSTNADPPAAEVLLLSGEKIVLDGRTFLVLDGVENPGGKGGPEVLRQAPALLIGEPNEPVWLRQAERKTRCAGEICAALAEERDLLTEISQEQQAVPRPLALLDEGRTRTLVHSWPRSSHRRFETLAEYIPSPDELDSITVRRTLAALAGLAAPLESLHHRGRSHRELAPGSIVRIDDENLALRDLGGSARPPVPGEPAPYPAPEQTLRAHGAIGPWTDVFQLAAVAYHQISGHRPHDSNPLPARLVCPVAPEDARASIDAALAPVPANRPTVAELAAAFRK
ncbi:hypothetical protein [Saccharopolyspora shandongensis]|uniref:hypothetical protein n=1 Tax=Saccharopolyspora shandongensis TaxID=418495 RepID=UPI0033DB5615